MSKFKIGDRVSKPKGYSFDGVIVSVFKTKKDDVRYVAEFDNGMLHIFNESQLELDERTVITRLQGTIATARSIAMEELIIKGFTIESAREEVNKA